MHELAAVDALVSAVLTGLPAGGARVSTIRVRRGSAFSEDALLQGFDVLTRGTRLEGARLEIDVFDVTVSCDCGRSPQVTADDLVGHLFVCAECGAVQDVAEADDLALVEVRLAPTADSG